jgi:hypothetical protein
MRPFLLNGLITERENTMRGTGPVGVNGTTVYAYYTQNEGPLRLRLSVDEADRLGLIDGMRLKITLPGKKAMDFLATATERNPPYVWLQLEPLVPHALRPTG